MFFGGGGEGRLRVRMLAFVSTSALYCMTLGKKFSEPQFPHQKHRQDNSNYVIGFV